ncbi:MAG: alpha/beta fold hydrolase [Actinomycetales bacterium]|nr:alpha/beta fold hydrolase [Actinomycetales bacterium]
MRAGERHATRVRGHGERVYVLAHGLGGTQRQWDPIAEALADDHTVVTFDLAGSGDCDPTVFDARRHSSILGFADDLAAIMAELDLRGATYVGHSMSGTAGALVAAVDPGQFSQLVLICASPRYVDDPSTGYVGGFTEAAIDGLLDAIDSDYALWSTGFAPHVMKNSDRQELALEFTRTLQEYSPEVAYTVMKAAFTSDFRSHMSRVTTPALLLQSHDDPAVPLATARWLEQALPNAELRELPQVGHFPHVVDPQTVLDAIRTVGAGGTP